VGELLWYPPPRRRPLLPGEECERCRWRERAYRSNLCGECEWELFVEWLRKLVEEGKLDPDCL